MPTNKRKGVPPPRYDAAFKAGAIRLVTEQNRPCKEVAEELGICIDTLKSWLKAAGHASATARPSTANPSRIRALEAENRALKKTLAEKEETIDVLKKSVGIFPNHRGQVPIHFGTSPLHPCGENMPDPGCFQKRLLCLADKADIHAKASQSGTVTRDHWPPRKVSIAWLGWPLPRPPAQVHLLTRTCSPPDEEKRHPLHSKGRIQGDHQF